MLARFPQLPDVWYNLARRQRQEGAYEDALESYAQALARGANAPEEVHLNRAVIFTDELRQDEQAELELRAALKANPAYLPAWQNLANLQEDLGRRDEARESYEQILKREPQAFEALARYSQLFSVTSPTDPLIARLRAAACQCRGGCRQPREPRLRPRPPPRCQRAVRGRPLRRRSGPMPTAARASRRRCTTTAPRRRDSWTS